MIEYISFRPSRRKSRQTSTPVQNPNYTSVSHLQVPHHHKRIQCIVEIDFGHMALFENCVPLNDNIPSSNLTAMENHSDSIVRRWIGPHFQVSSRLSVNTIISQILVFFWWIVLGILKPILIRRKLKSQKKLFKTCTLCLYMPILCQNRQNLYGISITKLGSLQLRDQLRNFSRLLLAALAAVETQVIEDSSDTHDFKHRKSP